MQSEDTNLTTESGAQESGELAPFIPITETLLKTANGEIGTKEEQEKARYLVTKAICGPIGKLLEAEF